MIIISGFTWPLELMHTLTERYCLPCYPPVSVVQSYVSMLTLVETEASDKE